MVDFRYSGLKSEDYLTDTKRSYYLGELNKFKQLKHDYWSLDKGIESIIDSINQNQNVVTIFSKKPLYSSILDTDGLSYLHIVTTELIADKIDKFILDLDSIWKNCDGNLVKFFQYTIQPGDSENFSDIDDEFSNFDAISNVSKYTSSNICVFNLGSYNVKHHKLFWDNMLKLKQF